MYLYFSWKFNILKKYKIIYHTYMYNSQWTINIFDLGLKIEK